MQCAVFRGFEYGTDGRLDRERPAGLTALTSPEDARCVGAVSAGPEIAPARVGKGLRIGIRYAFVDRLQTPRLGLYISNQCTLEVMLTVTVGGGSQQVQLLGQTFLHTKGQNGRGHDYLRCIRCRRPRCCQDFRQPASVHRSTKTLAGRARGRRGHVLPTLSCRQCLNITCRTTV